MRDADFGPTTGQMPQGVDQRVERGHMAGTRPHA
jgi:hypothetical protein